MKDFASSIGTVATTRPKGVAKVAAARKLAVRLYWMLRSRTWVIRRSPISRAARGCPWPAKASPQIDWALSHPDGPVQKTAQKRALENGKAFSTFAPARRLDVRMEESWLKSKAVSMVGGTRCSTGSDQRVMFPESWSSNCNSGGKSSGACAPLRKISP